MRSLGIARTSASPWSGIIGLTSKRPDAPVCAAFLYTGSHDGRPAVKPAFEADYVLASLAEADASASMARVNPARWRGAPRCYNPPAHRRSGVAINVGHIGSPMSAPVEIRSLGRQGCRSDSHGVGRSPPVSGRVRQGVAKQPQPTGASVRCRRNRARQVVQRRSAQAGANRAGKAECAVCAHRRPAAAARQGAGRLGVGEPKGRHAELRLHAPGVQPGLRSIPRVGTGRR